MVEQHSSEVNNGGAIMKQNDTLKYASNRDFTKALQQGEKVIYSLKVKKVNMYQWV